MDPQISTIRVQGEVEFAKKLNAIPGLEL